MTRFVSTVPRSLLLISAVVFAASLAVPQVTQAQRTTFTYQGYLEEGGAPAQNDKDLRFALYDSQSGGSQVGQTITKQDVGVADGVFSVELDFGAAFAEAPRYLDVGVRDAGSSSSFTSLSPREVIRPAPIAASLPNVTVDGSGNVGIGTTSPSSRLTVDGPIEATSGGVTLPDGTVLAESDDLGEDGDITAVNTTGALEGGGDSGDLTLRLTTACSSGEIVKWNGSSWVCSSDDAGGGLPTTGSGAFDLSNDEGLVGPGTFGTGSIPATGAGTRMMWYPVKAAFRAGRVGAAKDGTQWDASKVGDYSVAFGVDTKANGFAATAIGDKTTAAAPGATAMGTSTTASGNVSTAMGVLTTASDQAATAMGRSTTASSRYATAMGLETTAASKQSLSIGAYNSANTSADGTLFVAGNGDDSNLPSSRSDALVLDDAGNLTTAASIESESGGFVLPDGTTLDEGSDVGGLPTTSSGAFDLSNDGGVVAPGTFGTGSIPASGSGTRMMWYPAKGAFRAGRVGDNKDGTQWDASKVGDYSVAFGVDTKANGFAATAMGNGTTASILYATAMGNETIASGNGATAMGQRTIASALRTTAMGFLTTASDEAATAMGERTTASGRRSTAMGFVTEAATNASLSIGEYNSANTSADGTLFVAGNGDDSNLPSSRSDALVLDKDAGFLLGGEFGTGSIPAEGAGTRMMWYPGKAAVRAGEVTGSQWDDINIGDHSVAFGENPEASGENATAMGNQTTASGDAATAIGAGATASSNAAMAMGSNTTASGFAATAMGQGTTAASIASLSIGALNSANTSADNTLFVAGNGSGSNSRSDALVLKQDGDLAVGPSDPQDLRLHVTKDKANAGVSDSPGANMVLFENTNDGTRPDVLGLQAGPTDPGSGVTYISFYQRDGTSIGGIEGNGSGGVNYQTSGSDYAEELPMRAGSAPATPTDLVAVRGGAVSLDTDGAQRLMIVTDRAAVTGNVTSGETTTRVPVAFVGQVPVQLNGTAEVGDLVVASGESDGTARAVSPEQYRPSEHGPIAGRAWSAKPTSGSGTVTVAVGLDQSGALAEQLRQQRQTIRAQNERLQSQEEKIDALEERLRRVEERIQK